jgi:hypothetical protein
VVRPAAGLGHGTSGDGDDGCPPGHCGQDAWPAQRDELLDRGRPVGIGGHKQRLPALAHDPAGQLGRGCRLARTLQAHHGDDGRRTVEAEGPIAGGQDVRQLLVDDLDDHLAGVGVLDDVTADGALPDAGHEVLDDLALIGLQERRRSGHGRVDIVSLMRPHGESGEGVKAVERRRTWPSV